MEVGNRSNKWLNETDSCRIGNSGSDGDGIKTVFDIYNKRVAAGGNVGKEKLEKAGRSRFDILNENLDEILEDIQRKGKAQAHNDDVNEKGGMIIKKILANISNRDKSCEVPSVDGKMERPRISISVSVKDGNDPSKLKGPKGSGVKKSAITKGKAQKLLRLLNLTLMLRRKSFKI
ncbi:hypothetical protein ACOSP7_010124 [Xanthoceras sorbifolium]